MLGKIAEKWMEQRKARRAEALKTSGSALELRSREAQRKQIHRRETAADEMRVRHAETHRQRRQANPAVRNTDVEGKRQRRADATPTPVQNASLDNFNARA